MTTAHYHLLVNHLPILFPLAGLLTLAGGLILRNETVKRTGLFILIAGAATTFLANATGDKAEHAIGHLVGVSRHLIHEHEEMAETFSLLCYGLGILSCLAFWASLQEKSWRHILNLVILLFGIVWMFFAQKTGSSGGEIRHPEIQNEAPTQSDSSAEPAEHE